MRIVKIGKRQFAFGLNWNAEFGDDAEEAVLQTIGDDSPGYYTVVTGLVEDNSVLGFAQGSEKGSVYSYAEALAKRAVDGYYIMAGEGSDQLWFALISNGRVVPGTDVSAQKFELLDQVEELRAGPYALPIFVAKDCDAEIRGATQFDPEAIIAKVKIKPLKQVGKGQNQLVGLIVLLAVIGAIGFGGYKLIFEKNQQKVDPAVQAAQKRAAYVAAVQSEVNQIPTNAAWVANAYREAALAYPQVVSGFLLDGVKCDPTQCVSNYSLDKETISYSLTGVWQKFGRERVALLPDRKSLSVALPITSTEPAPITEEQIFSPAKTRYNVLDVLGGIGMRFAEVAVDGDVKVDYLNQNLSGPSDAPPLVREVVATRYEEAIDLVMVRTLAAYMGQAGFVATSVTFSMGGGAVPAGWRIEWARVHGGDL